MTFDEWKNGEISTPRPASMGGPADGNIRMADWVGWTTSVLNGLASRPAIDTTAVQSAVTSGVKEALSDPAVGVAIGKGILAALGVKLP